MRVRCKKSLAKLNSPFLNGHHFGTEIRNEFSLSVVKKICPLCSNSLKWRDCSSHRKNESNQYQKLSEIEKEIVREVARGDKPYLRKSTDLKAQISPLNWTNVFLICALRSVDFLR